MEKLDFETFEKKFENIPEEIGTESEIDEKRNEFIKEYALDYVLKPVFNTKINGIYSLN